MREGGRGEGGEGGRQIDRGGEGQQGMWTVTEVCTYSGVGGCSSKSSYWKLCSDSGCQAKCGESVDCHRFAGRPEW